MKWYKKPSNWITIVISIILIPLLIINASIIIQANTNKDEVPSVFGYKPFIVLSGSMEYEIHQGDLIFVKIINPKTLREKDIIAFRDQQGTVTTHRIIDIVEKNGETYFVTKGDNNNSQDQNLVEFKDVEGIYVFRIGGVGKMLSSLSKPTTIIIIVLLITVAFGSGFYLQIKKQREQEMQEFLEYKKQKELEEKELKKEKLKTTSTKKTTSIKKVVGNKNSKEAQKEVKPVIKKTTKKSSK